MDFPIQTFGGTKHFLPQALAAWEERAKTEEAKQEAEMRIDAQLRGERDEWEGRRRLAEISASLPADTLEIWQHRAEEALATNGVDRTRLGYEVLVKLK